MNWIQSVLNVLGEPALRETATLTRPGFCRAGISQRILPLSSRTAGTSVAPPTRHVSCPSPYTAKPLPTTVTLVLVPVTPPGGTKAITRTAVRSYSVNSGSLP